MEIRGLTLEQIEQAVETASANYGGNLELAEFSYQVKLPEPIVTEHTYTVQAGWKIMSMEAHTGGSALPENWQAYYDQPFVYGGVYDDKSKYYEAMREACEKKVERLRENERQFAGVVPPTYYRIEWIPEHEKTYTRTQTHETKRGKGQPLNKRGDAWRVRFRVKSARRPGSRVSLRNMYLDRKPKRIASACWHAHRDIFRAMFEINPETKIRTVLEHYKGEDHFEDAFPATAYAGGWNVIHGIGEACNCDEGEYPHYAIEGLTESQYQDRMHIWKDEDDGIKPPKRDKALLPE